MTIKDKVRKVFSNRVGRTYSSQEIIHLVEDAFPGTNRVSVIPSDYCYNTINRDPSSFTFRIFECCEDGTYKCLGENARYSGPVTWGAKGAVKTDVGKWVDGELHLWQDPRE